MTIGDAYDAGVVGSGPNGLAAAITLAQAGLAVVIFEAKSTLGGGMRSAELTLPGFIHDVCSAVHPLAIASPFFRQLPLAQHGLEWIHPLVPLAHPFDDGTAVLLERSIDLTSQQLGVDGEAYKKLMTPFVVNWDLLAVDLLAPLHLPQHPLILGHFALSGVRSANSLAKSVFKGHRARALFAGLAAHSMMPLEGSLTAAFGLILGVLGHSVGWPISRGGSQNIAGALASIFQSLGGAIVTNRNIETLVDLPSAHALLFDVTPKQLLNIVKKDFPSKYILKLKNYRYGPGISHIPQISAHLRIISEKVVPKLVKYGA